MRWPWHRASSQDQLFVCWAHQSLAYLRARRNAAGGIEVRHWGVEHQGTDSLEMFVARLKAQGFGGLDANAVLRPEQCQLLQIAAPAVAPEELRSAVRYQIRDMVDLHIDDLTLDVMYVGDGQEKGGSQLFVVAAANAVVREVNALADAMDWTVPVIEVQETAQRNLQCALADMAGLQERATAALIVTNDHQALLTISAHGELYYSRRLELPEGFLSMEWSSGVEFFDDESVGYTPVAEYIPGYDGMSGLPAAGAGSPSGADRAQRFLVELQRSLDLWDRTWTNLPLAAVSVFAGDRTNDLSVWLSQELGQPVTALDFEPLFANLPALSVPDQLACMPLLGAVLRPAWNS